ncbi:contact-dependent growth inhibition system immunity protein [Streptomyces thermolilacinus]|uniref:contact-dependent growth inhibition system immunity protein n=1 Tax=Streptomyces thermolilacinus TaxID=285540 RepID=UPI00142F2A04|nr:contact-dependent growth inhibition system immunity protein [Streptomyces thermolilacinus]
MRARPQGGAGSAGWAAWTASSASIARSTNSPARWPDPGDDATRPVRGVHELRRVPLGALQQPGDLRTLTAHEVALPYALPPTVRALLDEPLPDACLYEGACCSRPWKPRAPPGPRRGREPRPLRPPRPGRRTGPAAPRRPAYAPPPGFRARSRESSSRR